MSRMRFYQPRYIARPKRILFLNPKIGRLCVQLIARLTCRKYAEEFRLATETICAGFRFGLTFAATLVSCYRKPKRCRPPDSCEAIFRPKTWLRSRRNGWSDAIPFPPA